MFRSVYLLAVLSLSCFSQIADARGQMHTPSEAEPDQRWEQFNQLIGQSKSTMMANPAKSLEQAREAENIALSFSLSSKSATAIATSLWLQSEALIRVNQINDALPLLNRALEAIDEEASGSKLSGDLLLTRGRVSRLSGDVERSLSSFHEAHAIFAELDIARSQSIALQSIGSIYNDARSFEKALEYYERADEVYSDDPSLDISSANNRANTLKELGRFDEALKQFDRALKISSNISSPLLEARILTNLATLHILAGDLEAADHTADRALNILQSEDDNNWSRFVWGIKAQVAFRQERAADAVGYITAVFVGTDLSETTAPFREMHEIAYEILGSIQNHDLALQHLEAFKRLDDHARDAAVSANLALVGARFDFADQKLQIQQLKTGQLERDIRLAEARAKEQKLLLYGMALLSLVIIVSIMARYLSIRRHRNEIHATNLKLLETVSRLNNEIERRQQTEEDLREAKEQAEGANHAKTQFLANMSHELRTPLNAIIGFAEVIAKEILGPNGKPEYKDYANDIHVSGKHLLSILNDVLDMARIDAGKINLNEDEFDIHGLVENSFRTLQEEVRRSEKSLVSSPQETELIVRADERMMHQVLLNLLSNAMKFTAPNGKVEVRVERSDDDAVFLIVEDDGIGIEADKLVPILEPFGQVESAYSRSQGGIGLGLPIVRSLVEAHGGQFTIESVVGEGTRAIVKLPASRVVKQAA